NALAGAVHAAATERGHDLPDAQARQVGRRIFPDHRYEDRILETQPESEGRLLEWPIPVLVEPGRRVPRVERDDEMLQDRRADEAGRRLPPHRGNSPQGDVPYLERIQPDQK